VASAELIGASRRALLIPVTTLPEPQPAEAAGGVTPAAGLWLLPD